MSALHGRRPGRTGLMVLNFDAIETRARVLEMEHGTVWKSVNVKPTRDDVERKGCEK